jgi:SAM-dependent methyltransferase
MGSDGQTFYDDDAVFATYMQHRLRSDTPNDTLEKPILCELIGSVQHARILDLGCGDAGIGRDLLAAGAATYFGIDGSRRMIAAAERALAGTAGRVVLHAIEGWQYPRAAFDLVISRLAIHYIGDFPALCARVHETLIPGGRFIFSVEHPVITSCSRGWDSASPRQDWLVDDYFASGPRLTAWLGGTVQKYHRTVEEYFGMLQHAGFTVEQLRESRPRRDQFQDEATYERRRRIPLFLFLAGRR